MVERERLKNPFTCTHPPHHIVYHEGLHCAGFHDRGWNECTGCGSQIRRRFCVCDEVTGQMCASHGLEGLDKPVSKDYQKGWVLDT